MISLLARLAVSEETVDYSNVGGVLLSEAWSMSYSESVCVCISTSPEIVEGEIERPGCGDWERIEDSTAPLSRLVGRPRPRQRSWGSSADVFGNIVCATSDL